MFEDYKTARKLLLMGNTVLQGTPIEQLRTIWDAAEEQYRSFTTSNKWVSATSAFYNGEGDGIVCDNCGGNHTSPKCPHPRDEARIARNREARLARQPSNRTNGGRNGGDRN